MIAFRHDMFQPAYRPLRSGRWELRLASAVLCPGYWSPPQLVNEMAALLRREDGEMKTWMSMTPMEIESQEIGCRFAAGATVVMGMGMGWAAANAALRPEVSSVTVVERDPEVLAMIAELDIFGQLPEPARLKIRVTEGDAFAYRPPQPADTLMADIWLPLFGARRDEEVRRMQDNVGARQVYFWGQEMVIADRIRRAGGSFGARTVAEAAAATGLALIGPALPDYPVLVESAARRWLK